MLVDQPADGLAVLEDERHLARAHLEHRAGAAAAGAGIAEAGIEEAGIVHAEFADQRIERHHLGGVVGRHLHRFLGRQDVELVGIEHEALVLARLDRLPELGDVVAGAAIDIDQPGVALGAVADEAVRPEPAEIDTHRDALPDIGVVVVDQPLGDVQRAQRRRAELRIAVAETDLRQPRALAHQHRERLRADLGVERAVIAGRDAVEAAGLVGDHAGEHVEPSGRAFRIGGRGDVVRERQALDQRHDVDAVGLQHRAVGERDLVQLEILDALGDGGVRPRQEARAHAEGGRAEPQVEARGLDLVLHEFVFGEDGAVADQRADHLVGQDAPLIHCKGERHCYASSGQIPAGSDSR